jgi:hypothetical protein
MTEEFENKLTEVRADDSRGLLLVDWSTDWADEMDIYSKETFTVSEMEFTKHWLEEIKGDFEEMYGEEGLCLWVGTNEDVYLTWDWIHNRLNEAQPLTKEEEQTLLKFDCIGGMIAMDRIMENFDMDCECASDCEYEGM